MALVAGAHLAVFAWLAVARPLPATAPQAALTIDLVAAPAAATPRPPAAIAAKPTEQQPRRRRAAPTPTAASTPAPRTLATAAAAAPAAAAPTPLPALPSAPAAGSERASSSNPAAAPATAPALPVSEPRFDADYLANPAPAYPPLSRRLGEEGRVLLRVYVDASGRPGRIELKSSSDSPRLDAAAQDAVRRWQFVPARRGDEGVAAWVLVPIVFNLKG